MVQVEWGWKIFGGFMDFIIQSVQVDVMESAEIFQHSFHSEHISSLGSYFSHNLTS